MLKKLTQSKRNAKKTAIVERMASQLCWAHCYSWCFEKVVDKYATEITMVV